ncbi:hypothetical protein CONCODRAFT_89714 [Conidiobolus coronatus NRRL 28638]|uniref:Ubiquitin-like domain-containing protein n=1 Tax=Conidiobolus coronatus (strain ATCC 28846 / CBS 209.66 / NRRL 28638) TaxID=796925 RepID=A0A137PGM5_CONC2|nr:hypothetical protein CONCODRAFT_89714 [Conidiobolus coronatus NRRL 28638]|eukprot:KXN74125.1 hypothetical protein CONCODRAFT_89714 [Conidiobolus coronatus NRRL 28638]
MVLVNLVDYNQISSQLDFSDSLYIQDLRAIAGGLVNANMDFIELYLDGELMDDDRTISSYSLSFC